MAHQRDTRSRIWRPVDRQEFYEGEAEDLAEVYQLGVSQRLSAGSLDDIVVVREWNPLEPDVVEDKYHAPGVGVVLELKTQGGDGRVELTEFAPALGWRVAAFAG